MKKTLTTLMIVIMALVTMSSAMAWQENGGNGIIVKNIQVSTDNPNGYLALILDKAVYTPGATGSVTIGSSVPCNTKNAYMVIETQSGTSLYSKDITGLLPGTCVTAYVKATLTMPSTPGGYVLAVDFKDGNNQVLYRDVTQFSVQAANQPVVCPNNYCTSWVDFQSTTKGEVQQKTCYFYAASGSTCTPTAQQYYQTRCDSGFQLINGKCQAPLGTAVCGDGVVQQGESCDLGQNNGACPSACSATCVVNACQTLPVEGTPGSTTPPNQKPGYNVGTYLLVGGLLVVGFWLVFPRRGNR